MPRRKGEFPSSRLKLVNKHFENHSEPTKKMFKEIARARIGVVGVLSLAGVFAWNESESYRLAQSIQTGQQFKAEDGVQLDFCTVPLAEIKCRLNRCSSLSGIVGPRSTGKTYALHALGLDMKNVVTCSLNSINCKVEQTNQPILAAFLAALTDDARKIDLPDEFIKQLRSRIYVLPWPLNRLRLSSFDSHELLSKVFSQVKEDTGVPVTMLLDIDVNKATMKVNTESIVRQLKSLCADDELMRCVFSASEGNPFQDETRREPRLELFLSHELSIEKAIRFLKEYGSKEYQCFTEDELNSDLKIFPRTFTHLMKYAHAGNRTAFVQNQELLYQNSVKELSLPKKTLTKGCFPKICRSG
jgi:hypothetical protein